MVADHLVGSFGRLAAGPERNEHAGDNGHVHLYIDAVLLGTDQMSTAQNMLEESKERFDGPAPRFTIASSRTFAWTSSSESGRDSAIS